MSIAGKTVSELLFALLSNPACWIIAGVIVAAVLLSAQTNACRSANWKKKASGANQNIQNSAVNAAVSEAVANATEKQVNKLENTANEKANISNQAAVNYNAAARRDSGSFSNSAADARREYCRDNPNDSLCRSR